MTKPDDADTGTRALLERASVGEAGALDRLLEHYMEPMRAFVRLRMSPELRAREATTDVLQSICVEILQDQAGFEYRSEPQFRAWIFQAALNKIREKGRYHGRQKRDLRREVRAPERTADLLHQGNVYVTFGTPSQELQGQEHAARIEAAFDELPEHYREILTLAKIAELPHDEIAARVGKSVGAVRQTLGRALLKLGEILEPEA